MDNPSLFIIGLIFTSGSLLFLLMVYVMRYQKAKQMEEQHQQDHHHQHHRQENVDSSSSSNEHIPNATKKSGKQRLNSHSFPSKQSEHPWLATVLKGQTKPVTDLDFSSSGKYLISCGEDRSLQMWYTSDFDDNNKRRVMASMAYDQAKLVRFAPDSKSILICLEHANTVTVYKLIKKENAGSSANTLKIVPIENFEFPAVHKQEIIAMDISSNAKFVLTASSDTTLVVWDLKGIVLKTIDTHMGNNNCAAISPCGRFVAWSGFTSDVKVMEVLFSKSGEYEDVVRAFELKGHNSSIYSFAFNQDSTRVATASKDGTVRVYDINVRYQLGQDAILISTGTWDELKHHPAKVAIMPIGEVVAVACNRSIRFFEAETGEMQGQIDEVHSQTISRMLFSADGRYLVSTGDKFIRVFHNVPGYLVQAKTAKERLKTATTEAVKERLTSQIAEADELCQRLGV